MYSLDLGLHSTFLERTLSSRISSSFRGCKAPGLVLCRKDRIPKPRVALRGTFCWYWITTNQLGTLTKNLWDRKHLLSSLSSTENATPWLLEGAGRPGGQPPGNYEPQMCWPPNLWTGELDSQRMWSQRWVTLSRQTRVSAPEHRGHTALSFHFRMPRGLPKSGLILTDDPQRCLVSR